MPLHAAKELHAEWNGPSDREAFEYLHERGFDLVFDKCWIAPCGYEYCEKDARAIRFLHDEWGYPGQVVEGLEILPARSRQH